LRLLSTRSSDSIDDDDFSPFLSQKEPPKNISSLKSVNKFGKFNSDLYSIYYTVLSIYSIVSMIYEFGSSLKSVSSTRMVN
jgi:hypothetical protein